jgi:hypothetical protein
MGDRAAHKSDILQSGEANVGDILAPPAHQAVVFLSSEASANSLLRQVATFLRRNFAGG